MIKTFGLLDRRDDITKAQFHEHWAGIHAEHAVKLVPVMQRYVQNHCADENVPGFEPPCDGAPEVWLKDLEGAARLGTMPEYLNGAYIDEPLFMKKRSGGVLVSEEVIIEGPEIGKDDELCKILFFLKRPEGMTHRQFRDRWLADEDAMFTSTDNAVRFVKSPAVLEAYPDGNPAYDGVEELWWKNKKGWEKDSKGGRSDAVLPHFVDRDGCRAMFVDEKRVVWPGEFK